MGRIDRYQQSFTTLRAAWWGAGEWQWGRRPYVERWLCLRKWGCCVTTLTECVTTCDMWQENSLK